MGYYASIDHSDARIPAEHLATAYERMCRLNTTHHSQKRGGSWSGGRQTEAWFSWMDANYPDVCEDAQAILQMLGFDTEYDTNGDLLITWYDSKVGQEDLFLATIAPLMSGTITWRGEDGAHWRNVFTPGQKM